MLRKRLLTLIPTLIGVITLVFAFIHMVPGDPVDVMLGETAAAADKAALRAELGLEKPILTQYVDYLGGLVRGELGMSFAYRKPVREVIAARLPATLQLAGVSLLITLLVALPLGVTAAVKKGKPIDRATLGLGLLGVSIPSFWLGPLLILAFSVNLRWFPVSGRDGFSSVILPAITLGFALSAILSRMVRTSLADVLGAEYLQAARARGVSERKVIWLHAMRNAAIPVITILGLQLGALLSGAVIAEAVFAWPGIGTLLLQAINGRDYPVVQGCVLVISLGYVLANFLADLAIRLADPRVRG